MSETPARLPDAILLGWCRREPTAFGIVYDRHADALFRLVVCESMIEIVHRTQRNVKRWSYGEMALRWTAAGMLEAEQQFRKIIGYRDLATLVVAIEREQHRRRRPRASIEEVAIVGTV